MIMSKNIRKLAMALGLLAMLGAVGCGGGSQHMDGHGTDGTGGDGSGVDGGGGNGSGGSSASSSGSSSSGPTSSGGSLHPCTGQDLDGFWQVEATGSDLLYWQCDSASSTFTFSLYAEVMPPQSPPQFGEAQWTGKFVFQAPGEVTFELAPGSCPTLPTNTYSCLVSNGTPNFVQKTGANKGAMTTWVKNPPNPPTNIAASCGP
jgi:hypothetical protein